MGVGALIGAIVGGAAFQAGITLFGATLFASVVTGAALGYTLFDQRSEYSSPTYDFGPLQNTRSQLLPVPVIYGRNKIAGNIIYQSEPGKTIHMLVALGEGEIQSVTDIRVNDIPIGDVKDATYTVYYGTATQNPDSRNANNEALRHTAYIACTFTANEQISGSAPTVTAIVEGLKVDVWNGSAWVEQYSRNPAYCLLGFLTKRYGLGIPVAKIDRESFKAVAAYCDELVDGEPRFQLDIVIDAQMEGPDAISQILATFGGFLVYSDGMIRLRVDRSEAPVQAFTMDNIVEGSFSYAKAKRKDVPNRVVVEFIDPNAPEGAWERSKIVAEDEVDMDLTGEVREKIIQLWGVTRASQAGRMARFYLDWSRRCNTFCEFRVGIGALACEVGDVVKVSHEVPGWIEKLFRILAIEEQENDEMKLSCREYDPSIYHDRGVPYTRPAAPGLPNPFAPPPHVANLAGAETSTVLGDGTYIPQIILSWTKPASMFWDHANVFVSTDNGATWKLHGISAGEEYLITPCEVGITYICKVVSVSQRGVQADFASAPSATSTVQGKVVPPPDVTWGECSFGRSIVLNWYPVNVKDIDYYEVRTDANFGSTDSQLVARIAGTRYEITNPTQRAYTFYIKAHNRSGLYSVNCAAKTVDNPAPLAPTMVQADGSFRHIWVRWNRVLDNDLVGYNVYITPLTNPPSEPVVHFVEADYDVFSAETGITYRVQVVAVDLFGEGPKSAAVEATTIQTETADYGDLSIARAKIADAAIDSAKIADLAVDTAKIQDAAITTAKIANLAVTDAKINDLHGDKITAGTITSDKIASINADITNITAGNGAIIMNNEGVKMIYQGVETFNLKVATGSAYFKGSIEAGVLILPGAPPA